jgi:hypothetical protein
VWAQPLGFKRWWPVEPSVKQSQLRLGRRHEREAEGGAEEAGSRVGHR